MIIGCVKEIKLNEFRVGLTPDAVAAYTQNGHTVLIESNAGLEAGFTNDLYVQNGATILSEAKDVWEQSEMIIKVKEPIQAEYGYFRKGLILYTFLHLAADAALTQALLKTGVISIAYETIMTPSGQLPCLKPMSEVAGRLSILEGLRFLHKHHGGPGLLVSSVPGVMRGHVVIIGAGIVGQNALKMAVGIDAKVTILDVNLDTLASLDQQYGNKITTLYSSSSNIQAALKDADLVVGGVLLPGAKAPKIIKRSYYQDMKKGAVIVDVSIDQGGSTEVSRPTTHDNPVYEVDGITHYMVANMPGAVPQTSTYALNYATLKYGLLIADKGISDALNHIEIQTGLNTYIGHLTCKGVSEAFGLAYQPYYGD